MGNLQWIGEQGLTQAIALNNQCHSIDELTCQLASLQKQDLVDEIDSYNRINVLIHQFAVEIRRLEKLNIEKESIIDQLQEARQINAKSHFMLRLQKWPRGYQGDYETIEYLCDGINKTPPNTVEYYLEKIALASPIVQQHKNKVQWQAQQVLNTIYQENATILSIGCGGCRDLRLIEPAIRNSQAKFVLNDIDQGALNFAESQLKSIWEKITPIRGDTISKRKEISQHAPYNLIVAGGLFDYLPDRYACLLLKKLSSILTKNGKICFTNILKPNPWAVLVEYLANWTLIERTEDDFRAMFDKHGLGDLQIKMVEDSTSLAGLYEVKRA